MSKKPPPDERLPPWQRGDGAGLGWLVPFSQPLDYRKLATEANDRERGRRDRNKFGAESAVKKMKEKAEGWHKLVKQCWPQLKAGGASQAEKVIRIRVKKGELKIPNLPERKAVLLFLYTLPK